MNENEALEFAVSKLIEIADKKEAMFDGKREFRMSEACELSDEIRRIRLVANLLKGEIK